MRRRSKGGASLLIFEVEFAVLQDPEHVLNVHEAENVIEGSAIDRNARALRGREGAHHVVERGFDRERVHVGTGNHDFANLDLSEFDGAEDEFFFAGGEQAALARLLDLDLQLFGGVRVAVFLFSGDAERANESARDGVEERNRPTKGVEKPAKRTRDEQSDAFGAGQADCSSERVRR